MFNHVSLHVLSGRWGRQRFSDSSHLGTDAILSLAQLTISKIVGGVRMVIPVFLGLSYTMTVFPFHNRHIDFESVEIAL